MITEDVAAMLVIRDRKMLLAERSHKTSYAGLLDTPGGKPKPGERLHDAALRELKEETGLIATTTSTIVTINWRNPVKDKQYNVTYFLAHGVTGEPNALEDKHGDWQFIPVRQLPPHKLMESIVQLIRLVGTNTLTGYESYTNDSLSFEQWYDRTKRENKFLSLDYSIRDLCKMAWEAAKKTS